MGHHHIDPKLRAKMFGMDEALPSGFYPDPFNHAPLRWWGSTGWADMTSDDNGRTSSAPIADAQRLDNRPTAEAFVGLSARPRPIAEDADLYEHEDELPTPPPAPSKVAAKPTGPPRVPSEVVKPAVRRQRSRKQVSQVISVVIVLGIAIAIVVAVTSGSNPDKQNAACAKAVDALSANLESATRTSDISATVASTAVTTCPSRPIWRISAKVDDIATKLGAVQGVNDPEMTGTGDVALNSALSYLCLNYGPDSGSAACRDNN